MTIYNYAIGGGPLGKVACSGGGCGPGNLPGCCDGGSPDTAHNFEGGYAYFRALNFSKERSLACADVSKIVAGDGLLLFPVHAGFLLETVAVKNIHGCTGLTYHLELHDIYDVVNDATPLVHPTPEVVFPTINAATPSFRWSNVTALNAAALYWGNPNGTRPAGPGESGVQACARHKALVLILDTLPSAIEPVGVANTCVSCSAVKFGCSPNALACINLEVTAPVKFAGGLRTI